MFSDDWKQLLDQALRQRAEQGLFRATAVTRRVDAVHVEVAGRRLVDFSSNDYLGLSHHPRVVEAVRRTVEAGGFGAGASPLIAGQSPAHEAAERALARWKGTESAVLLPSGYQANHAAVQALAGGIANGRLPIADFNPQISNLKFQISNPESGTSGRQGLAAEGLRFLIDKLAHASLIDAVRGAGAPFRVYPHNHLGKLRRLLEEPQHDGQIQVVATESIFSMDGDAADLEGLAELKRRYRFVLLLDEAHASGVYGENGGGYAAERGLGDIVDLSIVTCSKALGAAGGAICASKQLCDAMRNWGRAYIYSTAIPASSAAAIEAAVQVLHDEPQRQRRVRELARRLRSGLSAQGWTIPPGDSPIIPIILGDENRTMQAAAHLRDAGLLVLPIRPPTVPRGTSRLRVTLSSMHSDGQVEQLIVSLGKLGSRQ